MTHVIGVLVILGFGFGLGRIHHASQLKAKIVALEATAIGDAKATYAKIKSLL